MNTITAVKEKTKFSQKQRILNLLSDGEPHLNRDIMRLFIPKYTCRISELRQDGIKMQVVREDNSNFTYQWLIYSDANQLDLALSMMPHGWIPSIFTNRWTWRYNSSFRKQEDARQQEAAQR